MKRTIDPNDREFLEQLHRLASATVQEICAELGVTATAVRQRLLRLQGLQFVERELVRSGRGRPHHTYYVTEAGLKRLGDNYEDLALILWRELRQIEEPDIRERIVNRVRDAFVDRYRSSVQGNSLHQRMAELQTALVDQGFDVEFDASGRVPVLRENNCPYLEIASSDPSICELEQSVYERVLGSRVTLTQCCLDGHRCCEFVVTEESEPLIETTVVPDI